MRGERTLTKRTVAIGAVAMIAVLAGCGSDSKTGSSVTTTTAKLEVAGPNPSISARMVCGEAKEEIADSAVGVDTVRPPRRSGSTISTRASTSTRGAPG